MIYSAHPAFIPSSLNINYPIGLDIFLITTRLPTLQRKEAPFKLLRFSLKFHMFPLTMLNAWVNIKKETLFLLHLNGISVSSCLIIISAKFSPLLFLLLTHRLAYPYSELPSSTGLQFLLCGLRRSHL